ncbi:thiamine biosynthesis protein ApbE [Tardibacter chloracetimidivorans]|uniref:FAD:protein FMN transferase n=1 Tax=Tardibacter chloracetimidivorans TaxID=1921510 RepID=A0A1L3ZYL3_9SPHN|nr:thiamine biosynthesis protein ApbE [Tardibacter chloracetimidivorans]
MTRVAIPLTLGGAAAAPAAGAQVESLGGLTMGTSWSARLVRPAFVPLAAVRDLIQQSLDGVVSEMSHWEPESQLSRFNKAVPGEWRDLPPGFFDVLCCALEVAEASDGAYDPTIGTLVDLWGFGPAPARQDAPSPHEIAAAMRSGGWQRLEIDRKARRARQPGGCRLDFSAIAKGHGVDRAADALKRLGLRHFLIEIGGELRGEGVKPDGSPWWVALERPSNATCEEILVALHGLSVATSGDYRRYFEADGRRYAHSIDPRTGWPLDNKAASVSVIHQSCMKADVHATAITIAGPDQGMAYAERLGLAALIVLTTGEERISPALAAMLD